MAAKKKAKSKVNEAGKQHSAQPKKIASKTKPYRA